MAWMDLGKFLTSLLRPKGPRPSSDCVALQKAEYTWTRLALRGDSPPAKRAVQSERKCFGVRKRDELYSWSLLLLATKNIHVHVAHGACILIEFLKQILHFGSLACIRKNVLNKSINIRTYPSRTPLKWPPILDLDSVRCDLHNC